MKKCVYVYKKIGDMEKCSIQIPDKEQHLSPEMKSWGAAVALFIIKGGDAALALPFLPSAEQIEKADLEKYQRQEAQCVFEVARKNPTLMDEQVAGREVLREIMERSFQESVSVEYGGVMNIFRDAWDKPLPDEERLDALERAQGFVEEEVARLESKEVSSDRVAARLTSLLYRDKFFWGDSALDGNSVESSIFLNRQGVGKQMIFGRLNGQDGVDSYLYPLDHAARFASDYLDADKDRDVSQLGHLALMTELKQSLNVTYTPHLDEDMDPRKKDLVRAAVREYIWHLKEGLEERIASELPAVLGLAEKNIHNTLDSDVSLSPQEQNPHGAKP
jgi:hypothetical protein